jgi:hypothetical protein
MTTKLRYDQNEVMYLKDLSLKKRPVFEKERKGSPSRLVTR